MVFDTSPIHIDANTPTEAPAVDEIAAPCPGLRTLLLQQDVGEPVLALGAENKSSYCLCEGRRAHISEPMGVLTEPCAYRQFNERVSGLMAEFGDRLQLVVHDLHPQYLTTHIARTLNVPRVGVQHHHAHLVSVMADWGITQPVIGLCCDGVGYGDDGAAWGCELMRCTRAAYERIGHLEYFPLIGGDQAAIENWRPAAAMLQQALGKSWLSDLPTPFSEVPSDSLRMAAVLGHSIEDRTRKGRRTMCSSLGRVFDAVSFLLGLCRRNDLPAQAAIALESAADSGDYESYPYEVHVESSGIRMSLAPAVRAIVRDLKCGGPVGPVAARFHETVASMLATAVRTACERDGRSTVVLSGGCFVNARLRRGVVSRLERFRLRVFLPRRVPVSDAGISLGQAVVGAFRKESD